MGPGNVSGGMRRARTAEIQIKGSTRTYELLPGPVRRIQLALVQSTALYGTELWWKGQRNHEHTIQPVSTIDYRDVP